MNTRFALLVVLLVACFVPASALGQEYVRNGTFDTLYAFDWQTSGQAWDPGNKIYPVATISSGPCFGLYPDQSGFSLSQNVLVPAGRMMIAKADFAVVANTMYYWPANAGVQIQVDGEVHVALDRYWVPRESRHYRFRLEIKFIAPASGSTTLRVVFSGAGAAGPGPVQFFVDNVSITETFAVTVHPAAQDLRIGHGAGAYVHTGTPGPIQLYVSPFPANSALAVPGWIGEWELDPSSMSHVFSFGLSTAGSTTWSFSVPNSTALLAVPIYWQSLHADTRLVPPILHLGSMNSWAFF